MLLLCAAGPKLFLTDTEHPRNEFVVWQEGGQLLLEPPSATQPYHTLPYAISWHDTAGEWIGTMETSGQMAGRWTAAVDGDRVRMTFAVTNTTARAWPFVVEAFVCYKHRSAPEFWDPELARTYIGWGGEAVCLRDRLEQLHGPGAFWPKNHLHRVQDEACFDRYDRVGLRNPPSVGWQNHRAATDEGWMAIRSRAGDAVSGIYWEGAQMLAQNGPDYGCLHAGITLSTAGIAPGETVLRRGVVRLGAMTIDAFRQGYRDDEAAWRA